MEITSCCGKEKDPPQNIDRCDKNATAVPMEQPMDYLLNSNKNPSLASHEKRRKHPREVCSIKAKDMVQGHWHGGSLQNISEAGAYIRIFQGRTFSRGEGIFVVARIRVLREQVWGKIAWVGPHGIGVEFEIASLMFTKGTPLNN
jgi:hypothetical protein